ncbi:histo-blood group ABO system transferase-like [Eleutherodactylus coqui]|uniref:histo-blood group ABO system transferase-like n=1 Tax=Eleutherodactylus coqui TaxID=57060 RepID=UPI003462D25F
MADCEEVFFAADERCSRRKCFYLLLCVVALFLLSFCWYGVRRTALCSHMAIFCSSQTSTRSSEDAFQLDLMKDVSLERRTDVLMMTPWLAPIVWNGSYNIDILNAQFHQRHVRIGLTVFAIKKYTVFMKTFIETAEKFFMVGHKVNYYVFTDRVKEMPNISLADGRQLVVLEVPSYKRWQEVSMRRMEMIRDHSSKRFINEVDYLVCVDVDIKFTDEVGVEILSDVFGTLHPRYFRAPRERFTYERRKASAAYIPPDEGDFYYAGGYFGGTVEEVYMLTSFCHSEMMTDKGNNIEAIWHDKSYLNKYFLYHKPTKVLSPEYLWDNNMGVPEVLKRRRSVIVPKNYNAVRNR